MKLWQPVRNTHISCLRKPMATQYNILSITRWEQWNLYYFLDFPSYVMFDDSSFLFWAKNWQYQRCILTFSSLPQDISVKATHRVFCRGVSAFMTCCPCVDWVRWLIIRRLYVGQFIGKFTLNNLVSKFGSMGQRCFCYKYGLIVIICVFTTYAFQFVLFLFPPVK